MRVVLSKESNFNESICCKWTSSIYAKRQCLTDSDTNIETITGIAMVGNSSITGIGTVPGMIQIHCKHIRPVVGLGQSTISVTPKLGN